MLLIRNSQRFICCAEVMNVEKLKQFLKSKKMRKSLITSTRRSFRRAANICILIGLVSSSSSSPCLSRSLTLLDWTFLLQKQFSIIICNASPQCRMQMLLVLAAPAWQLPPGRRCGRPRRQNQVEAANNVITQSLHVGVHSLRQQWILGIVDIGLAKPRRRGWEGRDAHKLI